MKGETRRERLNRKKKLDRDLNEQVRDGLLSPPRGDAMARKGGLIE